MDGLLTTCKDFIKLNKQWEKKMENNKKVKLEYIDGKLGFDFQDFFITNPFVSCCMRWEVDPIKEYGLTKEQIKKFKKIFTNRNRKKGEKNGQ